MIRAMCGGVELIDKWNSKELMNMQGLQDTLDGLVGQVEYDGMGKFREGIIMTYREERWIL